MRVAAAARTVIAQSHGARRQGILRMRHLGFSGACIPRLWRLAPSGRMDTGEANHYNEAPPTPIPSRQPGLPANRPAAATLHQRRPYAPGRAAMKKARFHRKKRACAGFAWIKRFLSMVRGAGLEPARCCHRQDLNLVRLPISPPARSSRSQKNAYCGQDADSSRKFSP